MHRGGTYSLKIQRDKLKQYQKRVCDLLLLDDVSIRILNAIESGNIASAQPRDRANGSQAGSGVGKQGM
jgi:hypothetical protein